MSKYPRERLVPGSIDVWKRRKEVYERHEAGETYAAIAHDLGISKGNVAVLADHWKRILEHWENYYPNYQQHLTGNAYGDQRVKMYAKRIGRLVDAGLLGSGKRSPEYAYA